MPNHFHFIEQAEEVCATCGEHARGCRGDRFYVVGESKKRGRLLGESEYPTLPGARAAAKALRDRLYAASVGIYRVDCTGRIRERVK